MRAVALRCEHREDVPCVDDPAPRLGWALESDGRDKRQSAYRILVAERDDDLAQERGTLWDSDKVQSGDSIDVEYGGRPLPASTECGWTVQVWDEAGEASGWSPPAHFRTGPAEWKADWIARDRADDPGVPAPSPDMDPDPMLRMMPAACPHLRRDFTLAAPVRRAILYATARGVLELQLNGERVGDAVLAPGWTDYRRRIEYAAHDVTALLRTGDNVIGAILGDGWFAGFLGFDGKRRGAHYGTDPELLCELHIEHEDGSTNVVASDAAWRASTGPLVYSDLLMGERYDARLELGDWSSPGFDDRGWRSVRVEHRDAVALVPERAQPMRVTQDLEPVEVVEHAPGVHIVDLGQNMVGWVRLAITAERGERVELRFAEMLEADGSLHLANLRSARQLDTYVAKGEGVEVFEPRFTFHGFRYVEVTGPAGLRADAVTGRVVHSDTPPTGSFECSEPLLNQLWRNIDWGQRGNFVSVPTDCPQRDERLGWLADAQVFLPTASLNRDVAAFITKWGDDVLDAQSPAGAYPDVAPRLVVERDGAPGWADAGVIVPWTMHRRYGDRRIVERHWDAMERYMSYLHRHNPDLLWRERRGNDFGDWLAVGSDTPRDVLATAYWAYDAGLMAELARSLGRRERAEHYERLRTGIVEAFNHAYVREDGYIEGDTQTVYLLALHMDLVPEDIRAVAAQRLVRDIERHGWHLTTGFIGVGLLCPVLTSAGYADVAYRLALNETFPSWGYSIRHGATTIWERWDGWTDDGGFQTPRMNSFNHYSFGAVGQWLYEYVAGIRTAADGYEHVVIAPVPGPLRSARATYRSVRGKITSDWQRDEDCFHLTVDVPANVSATVVLPGVHGEVTESGVLASEAAGVQSLQPDGDSWRVEVGSGRYEFAVAMADRVPA